MNPAEKILPFFPLNIALLPEEDLPLRIFEPRYKQLINECRHNGITFGIPFIKDKKVQKYGSEVSIRQVVAENSFGEMVIVVEGVSLFKLLSLEDPIPNKLYSGGKVEENVFNMPVSDNELIRILIYYMDRLDPVFPVATRNNEIFIYDLARALNLSSDDKFTLFSITDIRLKEKFLYSRLRYLIKLREQEKLLKNDYYLN